MGPNTESGGVQSGFFRFSYLTNTEYQVNITAILLSYIFLIVHTTHFYMIDDADEFESCTVDCAGVSVTSDIAIDR